MGISLAITGVPDVGPGAGDSSYATKVLSISRANLLGYWRLSEATGTTADNYEGTAARDGTYSNITLGQTGIGDGLTSALFVPASTSLVNLYSTSLRDAFNAAEGTIAVWIKVSAAGVWADATARRALTVGADGTNRIIIQKTTEANTLNMIYTANNVGSTVTTGSITSVGWIHMALTWSKSTGASGQVKAYINGAQVGTTQVNLGTWAGALAATTVVLGAASTSGSTLWDGYLAHMAIWSTPLTLPQIALLATVPN